MKATITMELSALTDVIKAHHKVTDIVKTQDQASLPVGAMRTALAEFHDAAAEALGLEQE